MDVMKGESKKVVAITPLYLPPEYKTYSDISTYDQYIIFRQKEEYQRQEEEYLSFMQQTQPRDSASHNLQELDCKRYLESNIYYQFCHNKKPQCTVDELRKSTNRTFIQKNELNLQNAQVAENTFHGDYLDENSHHLLNDQNVYSLSQKLVEHSKIRAEVWKGKRFKATTDNCSFKDVPKDEVVSPDDKNLSTTVCDERSHLNVCKLTSGKRDVLLNCLLKCECLSFTLIFNNGSTLFTNGHVKQEYNKKKTPKNVGIWARGMCAVLKSCPEKEFRDKLILFDFVCQEKEKEYFGWFSKMVFQVFREQRVVVFEAQKFLVTLINVLDLKENRIKDIENWILLDPLLGVWLMDADKSPKQFSDVLSAVQMQPVNNHVNGKENQYWHIKASLFMALSAMNKITQQLMEKNMKDLFLNIETRLIPILACMETSKIKIDVDSLSTFSDVLKKKMDKLESEAFASVGHCFCLNSHSQLRQVLYEELLLDKKLSQTCKMIKTNVSNQKSTSESMLLQLLPFHPLPGIALEYRQLQKLKSTYVDGITSYIENGNLTTHWDQISAATGRLASYHPNVQSFPKTPVTVTKYLENVPGGACEDSKMDIFVREPFISNKECVLLSADFQQIELRLLAHLSNDRQLLDVFTDSKHKDIFTTLTSQWHGKEYDQVSQVEREQSKRIVYSVMYGVGKERLADYLKVSPDNAKNIMDSFLRKFPAINRFTKSCIECCKQNGFTSTLLGRRRYVPNINHLNPMLRAQAERQCVNFCVQGSAADLCKTVMIVVESRLQKYSSRLLIQIHDELVWEVPEAQIKEVADIVKRTMEDSEILTNGMTKLGVPVAVRLCTGTNWAHMETLNLYRQSEQ